MTRMPPGFRDHVPQAPSASRACSFRDNFNLAYDARTQVVEEADTNILFGKSRSGGGLSWYRRCGIRGICHACRQKGIPSAESEYPQPQPDSGTDNVRGRGRTSLAYRYLAAAGDRI